MSSKVVASYWPPVGVAAKSVDEIDLRRDAAQEEERK